MWRLIFPIVFLFVSSAMAKSEVPNGGNSIVCFKSKGYREKARTQLAKNKGVDQPVSIFDKKAFQNQIASVISFDHFLFKLPRNFGVVRETKSIKGLDFKAGADTLIKRFATKSKFGDLVLKAQTEMPFSNWRARTGVPTINDAQFDGYLPAGCLLVQTAVQQDNQVDYDQYLFQKMSDFDKTALIIHEYVFKALKEKSINSAKRVYEIVDLIISDNDLESASPEEIEQRISGMTSMENEPHGILDVWEKKGFGVVDVLEDISKGVKENFGSNSKSQESCSENAKLSTKPEVIED